MPGWRVHAAAQQIGSATASNAGRGTNAINHAAVYASYLTSINAHVHTQPVIGHLPQTPAPFIIADIE